MPTCHLCNAQFPNRVNVNGKTRNLQNRKYCLSCSPFGRHNTYKLEEQQNKGQIRNIAQNGTKFCTRCSQHLPASAFYLQRAGTQLTNYCKSCANKQTVERQQALKRKCVDYKGGKCEQCGYSKYIGALEFHHLDRNGKDFNLSHSRSTTFEKVKSELDKCTLICANCHRELHAIERGLLDPE